MKPQRSAERYLLWLLVRFQGGAQRQGGYTLVVTIAMLLILSVLLVTYAITSKVDNASSMSSAKSNTGFYTAEAGLNLRAKQIRNKFEGYNRPTGNSPGDWKACLDANPSNDGTGDFACQTESAAFQTGNTKDAAANQIGAQSATTFMLEAPNNPISVIIPQTETYGGLSAQEYRYDVISVARDNQTNPNPTAIVKMQFKSRLIPLFQFAAFYEEDMDFTIPPTMTVNGRVHSNNDLYLNAAVGNTLAITGQVTAAGSLYRGQKSSDVCSGTASIFDLSNQRELACTGTRQNFLSASLTPWNNQIQVGLTPLEIPEPDSFDAAPGKLYWDNADLRVALNVADGSIEVVGQDGVAVPSQLNGTCTISQTTLTQPAAAGATVVQVSSNNGLAVGNIVTLGSDRNAYVIDSISGSSITLTRGLKTAIAANTTLQRPVVSFSDKTFKNYREKRGAKDRLDHTPIQMLNVDVRGLLGCASTLMGKPLDEDSDGGLVWFLTVKGSNSNTINDYGVRIYNGRDLVTPVGGKSIKGLSVVSDQAVYIHGDYNCGATCNNGNIDDDERKPAAVMADAVNVLSNNWNLDDSASDRLISTFNGTPTVPNIGRPASPTTVNAAALSGNDITGGVSRGGQNGGINSESGGVNNYFRFHEDWRNANDGSNAIVFTYQGSMVSLGKSRKMNGAFCGSGSTADCNIYNPPIRNWRYDPRFNDAANLPPLTPRAVYLRQERFTRDFEQTALAQPSSHLFGQFQARSPLGFARWANGFSLALKGQRLGALAALRPMWP